MTPIPCDDQWMDLFQYHVDAVAMTVVLDLDGAKVYLGAMPDLNVVHE